MSMSRREGTLAVMTLVVIMVGSVAFLFRPQYEKFRQARGRAAQARREIGLERDLIRLRGEYERRDGELQGELPSFGPDKQVDTHWLAALSRSALRNGLKLNKIDAGEKEIEAGNARELAIDCKEWKGSTDALLKFLHEVQSEGSSMDVRHIRMRTQGPSDLTGRLTVYCAYTREEPDVSPAPAGLAEGNTVKDESK